MGTEFELRITLPLDENGMLGRECPECKCYFKLKPGTGKNTTNCNCPFCDYSGESNTFSTSEQKRYIQSIVNRYVQSNIVKPFIGKINRVFKDLERNFRSSMVKFEIQIKEQRYFVPIRYYREKELETSVVCNYCNLEFAIYGVFGKCPDCNGINAFLVAERSIRSLKNRIQISDRIDDDPEIKNGIIVSVLIEAVSLFDSLGKELKLRKAESFNTTQLSSFQNITKLDDILKGYLSNNHSDFEFLIKMFQIRHIYAHNMGIVDDDILKKVPDLISLKGRKYTLESSEVMNFLVKIEELVELLKFYCHV